MGRVRRPEGDRDTAVPGRPRARMTPPRGVPVREARRLLLGLANVTEGLSYGMPSFLVNGRFLARFRDHGEVLVLQLATIGDRDVLMQIDPRAFFFTDHCRDYPAVLIRLAEAPRPLFADVVEEAWQHVAAMPPLRRRKPRPPGARGSPPAGRKRSPRRRG